MKREAPDDDMVSVKLEASSSNADAPECLSVFVPNDDSAIDDEYDTHVEGQATGVTAALLEAAQSRAGAVWVHAEKLSLVRCSRTHGDPFSPRNTTPPSPNLPSSLASARSGSRAGTKPLSSSRIF